MVKGHDLPCLGRRGFRSSNLLAPTSQLKVNNLNPFTPQAYTGCRFVSARKRPIDVPSWNDLETDSEAQNADEPKTKSATAILWRLCSNSGTRSKNIIDNSNLDL